METMPNRSRKKRPQDLNALAAEIVEEATGGKDPHAVALGRRGGKKGGKARAANMTPKERSEAARKAARARWNRRAG